MTALKANTIGNLLKPVTLPLTLTKGLVGGITKNIPLILGGGIILIVVVSMNKGGSPSFIPMPGMNPFRR